MTHHWSQPALCAAMIASRSGSALSQNPSWPDKPVNVDQAFTADSTTDILARAVSRKLPE